MNFATFSMLPPHFNMCLELSQDEWCDIFPGYIDLPEKFRTVCPFLLASLVRHHDWIISTFGSDQSHPFFNCRYYKNKWYDKLKVHLVADKYGECDVTKMQATGIPPELVIAGEVNKLRGEVIDVRAAVDDNHKKTLEILPKLVVDEMEGRVTLEGQVEVTRKDLASICHDMEDRLMNQLALFSSSGSTMNNATARVEVTSAHSIDNRMLWKHLWGGQFHPVPENFVLDKKDVSGTSTLTVKELWELWFVGHAAHEIPPYKQLKAYDLHLKSDRQFLSKCSRVMNTLLKVACEEKYVTSSCGASIMKMTVMERDDVFKKIFKKFNASLSDNRDDRRVGELKIRTYYNNICKHKCAFTSN